LLTARYINRKLIWDWKNLIEAIQDGKLRTENNIGPTRIDDEYIEFCKIKLNIRSLIYQHCRIDDLVDGWNGLNETLDLVRMLEVFLWTSMSRLNGIDVSEIYKFEPDVIDFLKICYWYSRIRRTPTIIHKVKELRSRLAKKLLYKLESPKRSIDYEGLSDIEIEQIISDKVMESRKKGTDINRKNLLNQYFDFVRITISELMFPSLAEEFNHEISFEPSNQDFDFDAKIDTLPFQVKTLISRKYFPISSLDIANHQKYEKEVAQIRSLYYNNQLNQAYVARRLLDCVKRRCISQINKSLEQKTKVIILDATLTTEGFLLNQLFTDDEVYVKFDDSIKKSIENYSNGYVNVVFASTAYDYNFRISTLAMKLPIKDDKIDGSSEDKIQFL
jgi:hypothetical protein